jgi:hypothetical protein
MDRKGHNRRSIIPPLKARANPILEQFYLTTLGDTKKEPMRTCTTLNWKLVVFLVIAKGLPAASDQHPFSDVIVPTPFGEVVFTGMQIKNSHFLGTVVNRARCTWESIHLSPQLKDKKGKTINWEAAYPGFSFHTFEPQSSKAFDFKLSGMDSASIALNGITLGRWSVQAQYALSMQVPTKSDKPIFIDDVLEIGFATQGEHLAFVLKNRTTVPIKLDWSQCAFVDHNGRSLQVMHSGVRYIEKSSPQAPTLVPPQSVLQDLIYPSEYAQYVGGRTGWTKRAMFPNMPEAADFDGKTISVFMPLEINGMTKHYIFTMLVTVGPK